MKVTCFQEIRVCLPGSRSKTPKSYFERDRVQQTLQIQEIQTGLGQKANACNIQIHRWFWTLGDKKLYKGWQNITFVILRSLDQQSYRFKVKKQFQWFLVKYLILFVKFLGWNWRVDLPLAISCGRIWRIARTLSWILFDDHLGFSHIPPECQTIKDF